MAGSWGNLCVPRSTPYWLPRLVTCWLPAGQETCWLPSVLCLAMSDHSHLIGCRWRCPHHKPMLSRHSLRARPHRSVRGLPGRRGSGIMAYGQKQRPPGLTGIDASRRLRGDFANQSLQTKSSKPTSYCRGTSRLMRLLLSRGDGARRCAGKTPVI